MKSFKLHLFPKFLVVFIVLAVIPLIVVSRMVISINDSSLQFEVQRYHHALASSLAKSLDDRLLTLQTQLQMAITTLTDPHANLNEKQKILSLLLDSSPHLGIVSVVSPSGEELMKVYSPQLAPEVDANPDRYLTYHWNCLRHLKNP